MKRTQADDWFSKCVRERVDWHCEKCGKYYPPGKRQGLHCSHIFSRRHNSIRYDPDNAFAHCFSCHQWFGGNPVEAGEWVVGKLGAGLIAILTEKKNDANLAKLMKKSENEIGKYYKAEFTRMMALRADGRKGRIEITGFN